MENKIRKTCRHDRPFKEIFFKEKNKDLLLLLINTCIPYKVIDFKYLNNELIDGNIKTKGKRVDLLLDTDIGKVDLELNSITQKHTHPKNMAYLCNIYSNSTKVGDDYNENIKVIQINLTYGMSNNDSKPFRTYMYQDEDSKKFVNNLMTIEYHMDNIMKFWYSNDKKNIEKYKYLIMLDLESNELKELSHDKNIRRYKMQFDEVTANYKMYDWISEEEDQRLIQNTYKNIGIKEGIKEGIKQGHKNGSKEKERELVVSMFKSGIPINKIQEITKLEESEVKAILDK